MLAKKFLTMGVAAVALLDVGVGTVLAAASQSSDSTSTTASNSLSAQVNGGHFGIATNSQGKDLSFTGIVLQGKKIVLGNDSTNPNAISAPTQNDYLSITDARGTGAGYNITVSATPFQRNGQKANEFSNVNISLTTTGVSKIDQSSGNVPKFTLTNNTINNNAQTLISQSADTSTGAGMGSYKIPITYTLSGSIPANAYAGTYTSTVTYTLASGPSTNSSTTTSSTTSSK